MWRGKPKRVPLCSSIHHSKFLIGLIPYVTHLWGFILHLIWGFLHLIRGLGPLFGFFHSFVRMVHWYWSLWLGNFMGVSLVDQYPITLVHIVGFNIIKN